MRRAGDDTKKKRTKFERKTVQRRADRLIAEATNLHCHQTTQKYFLHRPPAMRVKSQVEGEKRGTLADKNC